MRLRFFADHCVPALVVGLLRDAILLQLDLLKLQPLQQI
jgi:hypothetical protein